MHESLARMQRIDPNVLMSYDYLLAGIDYTEFQYMMLDYKVSGLPAIAYRVCVGCHVWGVRDSLIYLNTHPEGFWGFGVLGFWLFARTNPPIAGDVWRRSTR